MEMNGYKSNGRPKQQHHNEVSRLASKGTFFQLATKSISVHNHSGKEEPTIADNMHISWKNRKLALPFTLFVLQEDKNLECTKIRTVKAWKWSWFESISCVLTWEYTRKKNKNKTTNIQRMIKQHLQTELPAILATTNHKNSGKLRVTMITENAILRRYIFFLWGRVQSSRNCCLVYWHLYYRGLQGGTKQMCKLVQNPCSLAPEERANVCSGHACQTGIQKYEVEEETDPNVTKEEVAGE